MTSLQTPLQPESLQSSSVHLTKKKMKKRKKKKRGQPPPPQHAWVHLFLAERNRAEHS